MLAARLGNVTIANAVGNGVADDKLVYTYLPDLIRYYLGEEPILPNVDTWRLEEPGALEEVLDRLDELVVKPVDGSGGKGLVVGPDAIARRSSTSCARGCIADPRGWIAQPVVQLSTIPTLVDDGMRPRHADLRPFAVNDGNDVWVLPGGLTRVALPEGAARRELSARAAARRTPGSSALEPLLTDRDHNIQGLVADQAAHDRSRSRSSPAEHAAGPLPAGRARATTSRSSSSRPIAAPLDGTSRPPRSRPLPQTRTDAEAHAC